MLPRPNRLRKSKEFEAVYRQGKRWKTIPLTLYRQKAAEGLRVGIVASRKVGNAVVRNRLRRLVREVLRLRWSELRSGFNLVIVLQPPAVGMDFRQMDEQLGQLLVRAEVWDGIAGRDHL